MKNNKQIKQKLYERAAANGYVPGAHYAEDSVEDEPQYVESVLGNQETALRTYTR